MAKRILIPFLLFLFLFFSCSNKTELSEKQIAECMELMESYFADRSENLSEAGENRFITKDILKKYCHENVGGDGSKHYKVYITKKNPEVVSWEYDKRNSEDENTYGVEQMGKCSKFNFRFRVLCYGKVTLNDVEYYDEPKVLDTVYLIVFEHGKPRIAEVGYIDFVYEKDLPVLLENLGLQQKER